jgi:hypothetical protein
MEFIYKYITNLCSIYSNYIIQFQLEYLASVSPTNRDTPCQLTLFPSKCIRSSIPIRTIVSIILTR